MTLKRAEGSGNPAASADAVAAIKAALEEAGVTFSESGVTQGTRRVLPPEFLVRTLAFIDEINAEVAKTGDKIDTGELRIQTQNLGLFLWGMSLEVISEDGQDKLVLAVH
ncbi:MULTISPECIES: hypothetical protein [Roseobacteraceae]|uniref:hypothetical protein n=1 Tax=Roseobacteraceae TaxID=2854170 RepID=UPI0031D5534D